MRSRSIRSFAVGIALTAWAGLLLQCWVTYGVVGSVGRTLEAVLRYFTVTTSLLSAIVFTGIAAGIQAAAADWVVAGVAVAELLVGVVYALLLHGLIELSGGSAVANVVLHFVIPLLAPVFWVMCTRKGGLRWEHPLVWAIYPLVYLAVAIGRGRLTGQYPYPFVDVEVLGLQRVVGNAVVIAAGFLLVGFGVVLLDQTMRSRMLAPRE